jgi:putative acetyltransferase
MATRDSNLRQGCGGVAPYDFGRHEFCGAAGYQQLPMGVPTQPLLRPLQGEDWDQVMETYADAVQTLATPFYQPEQIQAWAQHPFANASFAEALERGFGLVGSTIERPTSVEAFALLDPTDRLSLLYCRGRSSRKGLATALVQTLEHHALSCGHPRLRTEASQLSRPLLERLGWTVDQEEEILFAGVPFLRWRMSKPLT